MLAASDPDKVIAVNRAAIVRDNSTPYTAKAPNADKRTATIRGAKASTPEQGATSEHQRPMFAACDPLNFGLRFHHFINGAKQSDVPNDLVVRRDVEYSVTKAYTAAIKDILRRIQWGKYKTLDGSVPLEVKTGIAKVVGRVLSDALGEGPFGLPKGYVNESMQPSGAMPIIDIVNAQQGQDRYNMRTDVSASFVASKWVIAIQEKEVAQIIAVTNDAAALDSKLQSFAELLYHEARHCQQLFWMMALLRQHPDDYVKFTKILNLYKTYIQKNIYEATQKITIPDGNLITTGLHRMLIFHYYWMILYIQPQAGGAYVKPDLPIAQSEVCKLLNVSPEAATKMASFEAGYRSQLHEEDAYACAEVVRGYWNRPDHPLVRNPGTCTADYASALRTIGARN
ncbi:MULTISPECIES: hypothetical protein [Burkholderia cepacia complex]|uniref:hypothetical protein n=1 Tax=Burkholderia cepacia complex TaxID=87882 RepID=UPI001E501AF8|nr:MULTISPECIES: hypothetical protein [Burkholderia cepacia complex]